MTITMLLVNLATYNKICIRSAAIAPTYMYIALLLLTVRAYNMYVYDKYVMIICNDKYVDIVYVWVCMQYQLME